MHRNGLAGRGEFSTIFDLSSLEPLSELRLADDEDVEGRLILPGLHGADSKAIADPVVSHPKTLFVALE